MKNRAEVAKMFLERHGYVTNRMFQEVGITHTGRNGVGECKGYFLAKGYEIKFKGSRNFLDNRWSLVRVEGKDLKISVENTGQMAFA